MRCSTPRRCNTACQPSGPWRNWLSFSWSRSSLTDVDEPTSSAGRTGTIVGTASGAQKTVCSRKDRSGSAAKNQPPMLTESAAYASTRRRDCLAISLERRVTAQAFPRDSSHFGLFDVVVVSVVQRSPVEFWHELVPKLSYRAGGGIILRTCGCS